MSAMDIDVDVSTVLATLKEEADADLVHVFYSLEDLYERKLWFQLTQCLSDEFFANPLSQPIRLRLYENFVLKFYNKIDGLKLIEFLLFSLDGISPAESLEYLLSLEKLLEKDSKSAHEEGEQEIQKVQESILLQSEIARVKLELGQLDESIAIIDKCSSKIDKLNSVDGKINASYYRTLAQLNKIQSDYNSFYRNSLLFLACIDDISTLPNKESIVWEISISALLGDKIYNFGEIIMHDIFAELPSSKAWLSQLLTTLNAGDLTSFNKAVDQYSAQIKNDSAVVYESLNFLRQKICITALIELVFSKPTNGKVLNFQEILNYITILNSFDEVEHLIMKCLSLGLIKGSINQIKSQVEINWVQPRTMSKKQIATMSDKLVSWNGQVNGLVTYMNDKGKELWV
ncbi:unnamed protein product [Kuraishia capsulata CBS 1993]|uniref:PCI domain-containing protein n=1 Tax=Kuraishia capsulata CBS 1993 TaxID=1382522 RepID=W6MUA1_9ASCO|nr:uncharacterized protein KUCA_T00005018001 [Kuraishia capsulata CBS 1993]CDK29032.1 unnamed protein product [Kuraishia capsulata CBS 1993]